jgi:hypothetical protein
MMKHNDYVEMIPFYVARTLTPSEERAFEHYLTQHPELKTEIDQWQKIAKATWQEAQVNLPTIVPLRLNLDNLPPQTPQPSYTQSSQPIPPPQNGNSWGMLAGVVAAIIVSMVAIVMVNNDPSIPLDGQETPQNIIAGMSIAQATITPFVTEAPPTAATGEVARTAFVPTSVTNIIGGFDPDFTTEVIPTQELTNLFQSIAVQSCVINAPDGANIHEYADRDAPIIGVMQINETALTNVISANGWYQYISQDPYFIGWVSSNDVIRMDVIGQYVGCVVNLATSTPAPGVTQAPFDGTQPVTYTPSPDFGNSETTQFIISPSFTPTP